MAEADVNGLTDKLRRLVETIDTANLLTEPLKHSIVKLLEISAADLNSEEASVIVRDGESGDLRFLAAIGKVAEQLIDMKIPAGKGIAGFVISSGQPLVVSNTGEESSFYAEVDKTTGYSTQIILATPLTHEGETIGVLEYVNRKGEPPFAPFTPEEMDRAAVCADALASLANAYDSAKLLRDLGDRLLTDEPDDLNDVRAWLHEIRGSAQHKEMLDIAILLREIANRGDAERVLCRSILESIVQYSDSKNETSFLGL